MTERKTLLFLCTGNSCRSQMAEGWARKLKSDYFDVFSAGVETHGLNPYAVKVMEEAGVDISGHRSKRVSDLPDVKVDVVVTVCDHARESCPYFPGNVTRIHKGFDDPPALAAMEDDEEKKMDCYRRVRDEIRSYVETLPDGLNP